MNTQVIKSAMNDPAFRPVPGMECDGSILQKRFRISSATIRMLRMEVERRSLNTAYNIIIPSLPSGSPPHGDSFFLPLIRLDIPWLSY